MCAATAWHPLIDPNPSAPFSDLPTWRCGAQVAPVMSDAMAAASSLEAASESDGSEPSDADSYLPSDPSSSGLDSDEEEGIGCESRAGSSRG